MRGQVYYRAVESLMNAQMRNTRGRLLPGMTCHMNTKNFYIDDPDATTAKPSTRSFG
jgi:hypothetical protein